jgi:hypothetical protein
MDAELIKLAPALGVGGVLALVMFFVHRADMKQHIANWQGQSTALIQVVKENTAAITALIAKLDDVLDERK